MCQVHSMFHRGADIRIVDKFYLLSYRIEEIDLLDTTKTTAARFGFMLLTIPLAARVIAEPAQPRLLPSDNCKSHMFNVERCVSLPKKAFS